MRAPRSANGDALCFALKAPDGAAIRVGRSVEKEIVIADQGGVRLAFYDCRSFKARVSTVPLRPGG